jgi:hypothetical protein
MSEQLGQHPTQPNFNTGTEVSSGDEGRPDPRLMSRADRPSQEVTESAGVPERPIKNPPFDNTPLHRAIDDGKVNLTLPADVTAEHFAIPTQRKPAVEPAYKYPEEERTLDKKFWTKKKIGVTAAALAPVVGASLWLGIGKSNDNKEADTHGQPVPAETMGSNNLPNSVVERELFQTLSPAAQDNIRNIEAMDIKAFRNLDQGTRLAYAQYVFSANSKDTFSIYEQNSSHELTPEIEDAYLNGVTEQTSGSVIEAVYTLRQVAISSMYEKYHGQSLDDMEHYSQGNDKSRVFDFRTAQELMETMTTSNAVQERRDLIEAISTTEPKLMVNDGYTSASSEVFSSANYSMFQVGTSPSDKSVKLMVTHWHANGPNGPVQQDLYMLAPLNKSFTPGHATGRYVPLRAGTESSASPAFTQNLNIFSHPA